MNVLGIAILAVTLCIGTVLLFKKITRLLGVLIVVSVGSAIAYFLWQSQHWAIGFKTIELGATEKDVVLIVGEPTRITDGTEWVEPKFKKENSEMVPGCVKEYWYNVFYFPIAYSFCFNDNSQLINKYNWMLW